MAPMVRESQEIAVVVVVKLWFVLLIRIRLLGQRIPNPVPGPERLKQPAKNDENKGITRFEELNVLPQGTK